jgi:hypothetical protein
MTVELRESWKKGDRIMALDDRQWGRILALAWLDNKFRKKLETNPITAFAYLKEHETTFRNDYGTYFLDELGLRGDNVVLTNFEVMSWEGVDFGSMSEDRLDECIQGVNIAGMGPDQSRWFWNSRSDDALVDAPATAQEKRTLTPAEWVRIYARLWMDLRIDEPTMSQSYKAKYGPTMKRYVEEFDKDPAETIKKIAEEFNNNVNAGNPGWKKLNYVHNNTRLFAVVGKPQDWLDQELVGCVRTGKVRNLPLTWVLKKC